MPPHKIWAEKGASSAMTATEKNSYRLTAVLTVRADGKKLLILFIIKGRDGGYLERNEIPSYPEGHLYTCSEECLDGQCDMENVYPGANKVFKL